ncbi:MAG TPA: epoxide hydrolase [Solirubrobacterales bacterium]|jgi:pimeloyl-ACP methyl ester carboxylesterase
MSAGGAVEPFRVEVLEAELEDLRERLARTRWPRPGTVPDWTQGVPLDYLRELCEYWRTEYDWRRLEARLAAVPGFRTEIDGVGVHFLHVRSPEPGALPLVLTHGWPGSVLEFLDAIGPLTEPSAHGGEPADAFHVVIPALPGYGFSDPPPEPGWNPDRIGRAWIELMARLGYERYGAQGGDWGSAVSRGIARHDPEHVVGIHLNHDHVVRATMERLGVEGDFEREAVARREEFNRTGRGYSRQQSTRPQTLGFGLADSPAGQCAWIVEKFHAWSDPDTVYDREALLDNITLYWLTNSAASAAQLYWEASRASPTGDPAGVPFALSVFPHDINPIPERWIAAQEPDLVYYNLLPRGGHFAAMEDPTLFTTEVRAAFRAIRGG